MEIDLWNSSDTNDEGVQIPMRVLCKTHIDTYLFGIGEFA